LQLGELFFKGQPKRGKVPEHATVKRGGEGFGGEKKNKNTNKTGSMLKGKTLNKEGNRERKGKKKS